MDSEVSHKSVVVAAQEVFDGTIALWRWDEEVSAAAAEEAGRDPWHAQIQASRSRGPRVWAVKATPDDAAGTWVLVPQGGYGRATELEALAARREGHLVVEPGEMPHQIAEKLKAVRTVRRNLTTTGAES